MSHEVIDLVINKCDVKHIISNFKNSDAQEKREKHSLLEMLEKPQPHETIIIDEEEQINKCKYHSMQIAESLGIAIPEDVFKKIQKNTI